MFQDFIFEDDDYDRPLINSRSRADWCEEQYNSWSGEETSQGIKRSGEQEIIEEACRRHVREHNHADKLEGARILMLRLDREIIQR